MLKRRIKWGILGTSFISQVIAEAFQTSTYGELAAIGSRSAIKAKEFADKFHVPKFYDDYQNLLNDKDIEAIYIGLPNHLHKEWTIRCAHAGKHILCEKPFFLNPNEAREVINEIARTNVICMEALMYRYHPFTKKLHELVKSNIIGNINLITATYTANIAHIANPIAGGSIRNLGCYPISLIRFLNNAEPIKICALGRTDPNTLNDIQASAILKFANNSIAVVSIAEDMEMFWQFDIYGSTGDIKALTNPWLPDFTSKIMINVNGNGPQELVIIADKPLYTYQLDTVSYNIITNKSAEYHGITLQDSLANSIVLDSWLQQISQSHLHIRELSNNHIN